MSTVSKFKLGPTDFSAMCAALLLIPLEDPSDGTALIVSSVRSKLRNEQDLNPFESQLCGKAVVMAYDFLSGRLPFEVPETIASSIRPFSFQLLRLYPEFQKERDSSFGTLSFPELF